MILLLVFACILSGCEEWIDFEPENSVTFGNAFETERDIEAALLGTEQSVRVNMTAASWTPQIYGEFSDYRNSYLPDLLQENDPSRYVVQWNWYYSVIASANVVLPDIDEINMPKERSLFYRGCIAFFKAFAYLDLIRRWGDCVLIRDEVETEPIGKTPWPFVADYAITQAREAVRLLPEWDELRDVDGNAVTHRARPCKGAANAVLAHLCAWKAASTWPNPMTGITTSKRCGVRLTPLARR